MTYFDAFNGDADGLCSLLQVRLVEPHASTLVTGVKRDVKLVARALAQAGDVVSVFDVSFDVNRDAVAAHLQNGVSVRYFDHHFSGEVPQHPLLEPHIDTAHDVCTSLIVDKYLRGAFRGWAIVAAYGDNLDAIADRLAAQAGYGVRESAGLRELGQNINYNAYGETVSDLLIAPDELYQLMTPYHDPFEFFRKEPIVNALRSGREADLIRAQLLPPWRETTLSVVYKLPEAAWARRVSGAFANFVASKELTRAHAVIGENRGGGYWVSVRSPRANPVGADALCRRFPSGGGRRAAAGIDSVPEERLQEFLEMFESLDWNETTA